MERPRVLILGGGISGLTAAWALTGGETPDDALEVCLIEAAPTFGGKIASTVIDGRRVDLGPDGFLARRPEAVALAKHLGLTNQLRIPGTSGAGIFARGKIRHMPAKLNLGIPTEWRALAKSRVLGPWALLRAGIDIVAPRHDLRGRLGDRAIGPLIERKLGRRVVETLVDPMIGGIHAGRVADMSAAATFPPLLTAAGTSGSLMHALRTSLPPSPADGEPMAPVFNSLVGSVASLIDRLVEVVRERGVELLSSTEATDLHHDDEGWKVETTTGTIRADGLVLAVPTGPAAQLVRPLDEEMAGLLETIDYASVGLVTFVLDEGAMPEDLYGTGLLVPSIARRSDGSAFLTTAVTYLTNKWPHLQRDGTALVRVSTGRIDDLRFSALDDEALVAQLTGELEELFGVDIHPRATSVARWMDGLPQYRVNHQLRVAGIESAADRQPNLVVTGAAYHGVGIPACIGAAASAADLLRSKLLGD
ncbi:MAG: protoporphyrinogen oxidase [Actinomycetota bacterium]